SRIPEAFDRLKQIRQKYNVSLVVFGHAGVGNLHPNIMCDQRDKQEMKRVEQAAAEIFTMAVKLGGTLSGEHGIGVMKASFMEMACRVEGLDLMKRLKKAWDPNNILNPGKIFAPPEQRLNLTDE